MVEEINVCQFFKCYCIDFLQETSKRNTPLFHKDYTYILVAGSETKI